MSALRLPPLSLYVHIPWCVRKCPYCDFNSHEHHQALPEQAYVDTLLDDLEKHSAVAQGRPLHSIFIGGGTPSLFSAKAIKQLLEGIEARIPLKTEAEITLEANPGTAEAERFQGYAEAGINRISLGIQSFDDALLESLGRIHDSDQALSAIEMLQGIGLASFNVDLMHGLPGQTLELARIDLAKAAAMRPPHLSWYQLTIEPNTVFHKQQPKLPAEQILHGIQDNGEALLQQEGYACYEVSAWSQPGYRCHHNLNYWQFGDYLGIGAGAHSKWTDLEAGKVWRGARTRAPEHYLSDNSEVGRRELAEDDLCGEFMMNNLRLRDGFSLSSFADRTGLSPNILDPILEDLVGRELLLVDEERVTTTGLGWRYLDSVIGEFF